MDKTLGLGEKLKKLRGRRGLNQEELATELDATQGYISELEKDKKEPSIWFLAKLAERLETNADYLLGLTDDLESPPSSLEAGVNHSDLLIGAIKSVGAQNEIMEMVRRNRDGILDRVSKGEFPYQQMWGWVRKYDPDGHITGIDIDPNAAEAWRVIKQCYLELGLGKPAIAEELNRRGIPSARGGRWNKSSVNWLFKRMWRYAGYTDVNSMSKTGRPYLRVKASWPAIISEEDVERLSAEQQRRLKARRSISNTYRFSMIVYCDVCHRKMTVKFRLVPYKNKIYQRESYRCPGDHLPRFCAASKIHAALTASIRVLADESTIDTLITDTTAARGEINAQLADLQARLTVLDASLLRADDAYVAGSMDAERYRRQVERIKQQRIELQAQHTAVHERLLGLAQVDLRSHRLYDIRDAGLELLNHSDVKIANAWLRQRFRVWVANSEVTRVEYL